MNKKDTPKGAFGLNKKDTPFGVSLFLAGAERCPSYSQFISNRIAYKFLQCMVICILYIIDIDEMVKKRITDEQAKQIVYKVNKCSSAMEFQQLEIKQKMSILKRVKQKGLVIRQISRLTGETYYLIQKA